MIIETQVQKIGSSLGIVLPDEALKALSVTEGKAIYLSKMDGGLSLTAEMPHAKMMEIAEEMIHRYPNALRRLSD